MANVATLVPFILYFEAGVAKKYMTLSNEEIFAQARKTGLANDPDDKGGLTMCGITYNTFATYCNKKHKTATVSALKGITYAEWLDVLKSLFWDRCKADQINNQAIANIVVDWTWASGITGIKRTQRILNVTADGIIGPKTIAAINSSDAKTLFSELHKDRLAHVESIVQKSSSQKKFLKGWKRRINALTYEGFNYD
jgi:lysozyme family protein